MMCATMWFVCHCGMIIILRQISYNSITVYEWEHSNFTGMPLRHCLIVFFWECNTEAKMCLQILSPKSCDSLWCASPAQHGDLLQVQVARLSRWWWWENLKTIWLCMRKRGINTFSHKLSFHIHIVYLKSLKKMQDTKFRYLY